MTARDDYPRLARMADPELPGTSSGDAAEALDEIDRLRAELQELAA